MVADIWQIHGDVNSKRTDMVGGTNAREHQDAGQIDCSRAQKSLDLRPSNAISELHTLTAPIFNVQFLDFHFDQQVDLDIGKIAQIGSRGVVALVSLDGELIPADASGVFTSDVLSLREAKALRRRDEGGCKRSSVFNICEG